MNVGCGHPTLLLDAVLGEVGLHFLFHGVVDEDAAFEGAVVEVGDDVVDVDDGDDGEVELAFDFVDGGEVLVV